MKIYPDVEITKPEKQLRLYGYENHFNFFIKLFNEKKLPNTILLSGRKGSGKATFAYHFANYLLSQYEQNKYSVDTLEISPESRSYKLVYNNAHPNFFTFNNSANNGKVKIEHVRNLLNFLNKTVFSMNLRIIIIDNIEYLNVNSSNALLKALEEPRGNTFFFIIHNSSTKILNTIKSRSITFNFFFNLLEKKEILKNILKHYDDNFDMHDLDEFLYSDTPGNILKYLLIFGSENKIMHKNKLSSILYLVEKYKNKNDPELLSIISSFIEFFYSELSLKNYANIDNYFINKYKILQQIDDLKKFNLDKKNFFISLHGILNNESY